MKLQRFQNWLDVPLFLFPIHAKILSCIMDFVHKKLLQNQCKYRKWLKRDTINVM